MNPNATIAQLYSLLINADGRIDEKEIEMGKALVTVEQLNEELFNNELARLESSNQQELFTGCVSALKKLEKKTQIRYIAWMCVIANSDGFMAKQEWDLIYKLYHKELGLPLKLVMAEQKSINKQLTGSIQGAA